MKKIARKLEKLLFFSLVRIVFLFNMKLSTKMLVWFFKRHGMKIKGTPRYISAKTSFDGTDYSLITIGDGVTISSNIRILTHDWSVDTVYHAYFECLDETKRPIGKIEGISIGDYSFIGTNSVLLPGTKIGKGVLIGAGSVVRGTIPDFSIVIGNPARVIGDSREYCEKFFQRLGCPYKVKKDA